MIAEYNKNYYLFLKEPVLWKKIVFSKKSEADIVLYEPFNINQ